MSADPGSLPISFDKFLSDIPPGQSRRVADAIVLLMGEPHDVATPPARFWCGNKECKNWMHFDCTDAKLCSARYEFPAYCYYAYVCRHCKISTKYIFIFATKDNAGVAVLKVGEYPPFGEPLPNQLLDALNGEEQSLLLKGRQCENQGFGIAAFAYYRRVVENSRLRLLERLAQVASQSADTESFVRLIEEAKKETQFTKAVERVKDAIPPVLLIKGQHNPLTLLHGALSEGLHNQDDVKCLELATSVRVVLAELIRRINIAIKSDKDIDTALRRLQRRDNAKN